MYRNNVFTNSYDLGFGLHFVYSVNSTLANRTDYEEVPENQSDKQDALRAFTQCLDLL